MKFHALSGLPRSGTTLLANVLAQNPKFHASSTSCLGQLVANAAVFLSSQQELKSEMGVDRPATEKRMAAALRGLITGWYVDHQSKTVFDKCRAWPHSAHLIKALFPGGRLIVMVRDLKSVFASIERQHRATPLISYANSSHEQTIGFRLHDLFAREGRVGTCIEGIEDLIRTRREEAVFVRYEDFVRNPIPVLREIYASVREPWFKHDVDDVQDSATDLDTLYGFKFPHHNATGKIEDRSPPWSEIVTPDVARWLDERFPLYNQTFGYAERSRVSPAIAAGADMRRSKHDAEKNINGIRNQIAFPRGAGAGYHTNPAGNGAR